MGVTRTATAPDLDDFLAEDDDEGTTPDYGTAPTEDDELDGVFEDEDEDERPVRSSVVQSGWAAAKSAIAESSRGGYTKDFKFTEEPQLVRFLVGDPIAVFKQHWVERAGRRSFTCLGPKCPLCSVAGHKPDKKIAFTILNLSAEDGPQVQMLSVGPRLAQQFETFHSNPKTGPLDKADRYWALSKSGVKQKTSYSIVPVKSRDLADDWELDPAEVLTAIQEATPLDRSAVREDTYADLLEVAQEIAD